MRIAIISDIHGNAVALDAVLNDIQKSNVDQIICLGDILTVGAQPMEVLKRLRELDCQFILGNHDAALLDLDAAPSYLIPPPLIPALHWCANQLAPEQFDFIRAFLPHLEISLNNQKRLLAYHGTPNSNIENIYAITPNSDLDKFLNGYSAIIMVGGHTHLQMLRQHKGTWVVNSGSVGIAFLETPSPGDAPTLLPWAEYAIIDHLGDMLSTDLRRVNYDRAAYRKAISESDTPIKEWILAAYSD